MCIRDRAYVDEQNRVRHGGEQRGRDVARQRHADHEAAERDSRRELELLEHMHLVRGKKQDDEEEDAHAHAPHGHEAVSYTHLSSPPR